MYTCCTFWSLRIYDYSDRSILDCDTVYSCRRIPKYWWKLVESMFRVEMCNVREWFLYMRRQKWMRPVKHRGNDRSRLNGTVGGCVSHPAVCPSNQHPCNLLIHPMQFLDLHFTPEERDIVIRRNVGIRVISYTASQRRQRRNVQHPDCVIRLIFCREVWVPSFTVSWCGTWHVMNGKGFLRKWSWSSLRYYPGSFLKDRKPTLNLRRDSQVLRPIFEPVTCLLQFQSLSLQQPVQSFYFDFVYICVYYAKYIGTSIYQNKLRVETSK
jgi:hypothetical protein